MERKALDMLRVVHLVDEFSQSNHGVLDAAVSTSAILSNQGIKTEIWFPQNSSNHSFDFRDAIPTVLESTRLSELRKHLAANPISIAKTIVVSHGAWRYPTRLAWQAQRLGCKWVYTPHGMLEPWSMQQKRIRKKLYWSVFERRYANCANIVRATSRPEFRNLSLIFKSTQLLPNGVSIWQGKTPSGTGKKRVLFLGRLHHKKAPVELVQAWLESKLFRDSHFELVVVGNDDGELPKLQSILSKVTANIELRPPVYGEAKRELFESCSFFSLPSHSEGFPVALLEAMAAGLIPLISDGCNLPDAFDAGIAIRLSPVKEDIVQALNTIVTLSDQAISSQSEVVKQFVESNYSIESIAEQQLAMYRSLANVE